MMGKGQHSMQTINVKSHIGPDGILRLELPVDWRDQDVHITVMISELPGDAQSPHNNIHWPKHGSWNSKIPTRIVVDGPPVSQTLIADRR